MMNNLHSQLRDIFGPLKKLKDGGLTKFELAHVFHIIFPQWFSMDIIDHPKVDFEEMLEEDIESKDEDTPQEGDSEGTTNSPQAQRLLIQN